LTEEESEKLNNFFLALEDAPHPLLLMDYDGTLAGFRVDRFQARPWAGVTELLDQIQQQGGTRMAIVTGRPATEIPRMLSLRLPIEVWGLHGAERLHPDGRRELEEASPEATARLDELRAHLRCDAMGGHFEDKPNAVVMHWRGRSTRLARQVEHRTRLLFEPMARFDGLTLLKFEAGLELRAGRDKGGAIREIIRTSDPGAPVVYLGDDFTDEAGFRVVNQARAPHLSVLVRRMRRDTEAEVWLKPPLELRRFLMRWKAARAVQKASAGSLPA
jgi:trehalose 6-phosphate phosphatase